MDSTSDPTILNDEIFSTPKAASKAKPIRTLKRRQFPSSNNGVTSTLFDDVEIIDMKNGYNEWQNIQVYISIILQSIICIGRQRWFSMPSLLTTEAMK